MAPWPGSIHISARQTFWKAVFRQKVGLTVSFPHFGPSGVNMNFRRLVIEIPKMSGVVVTRSVWHNNSALRSLVQTLANSRRPASGQRGATVRFIRNRTSGISHITGANLASSFRWLIHVHTPALHSGTHWKMGNV